MEQIEERQPRHRLVIRATCPTCGRMEVPLRNLHFWVDPSGFGSYSFVCPGCTEFIRTQADQGTLNVLLAASPPLGADDVHGFRRDLERGDWLLRLQEFDASVESTSPNGKPRVRTTARRMLSAIARDMGSRHRMLSS